MCVAVKQDYTHQNATFFKYGRGKKKAKLASCNVMILVGAYVNWLWAAKSGI
jgi:hypothetical protein